MVKYLPTYKKKRKLSTFLITKFYPHPTQPDVLWSMKCRHATYVSGILGLVGNRVFEAKEDHIQLKTLKAHFILRSPLYTLKKIFFLL